MNKSHKISKTKDRRLVDNLSAIAKQIKREYFYMSDKCLDAIISRVHKDVESVLVIDDAGLQVVRKLYDLGIKDVTLTFYTYERKDIFDNFVYIINNTFRDLNVKLVNFKEAIKMKFDLVISNPPYGKIGSQITKKIIDDVDYKDFINLEPGNDYFIDNNYKYIDTKSKPLVLKSGAFEDAAIPTTVSKLNKYQNDLTYVGGRLLLNILVDDSNVYNALTKLWLNIEKIGTIDLKNYGFRNVLHYDSNIFAFNSGGFDICNGYFAVAKGKNWTSSVEYNVFHKDATGTPHAMTIRGCDQFKKLIYSELGLRMLKLWFSSSDGWGFRKGMFANIDYSNCLTWNDVFNELNISEEDQKILIDAANKFDLTNKEKEICEIVKNIL